MFKKIFDVIKYLIIIVLVVFVAMHMIAAGVILIFVFITIVGILSIVVLFCWFLSKMFNF
jgi:uncharacterized Tic20 family protein